MVTFFKDAWLCVEMMISYDSARLSYPDIEECNTIIASILGVEVFHAYFVHPNVVGLAKLLLKLSLRLLSKYFSIQT